MKAWYLKQKPAVRLMLIFAANFIFWFLFEIFWIWVWPDEDNPVSLVKMVSRSVFSSLIWTILLTDKPLIKAVFSRQKKQQHENGSDAAV